jgi:hypothetical protein
MEKPMTIIHCKRNLLLGCTAMLFLTPTCTPETTVANRMCGGYDEQHVYSADTSSPKVVHDEITRRWPNQPLYLYAQFGVGTGSGAYSKAVEDFFAKVKGIIDYARPLKDLRFQERSFKRIERAKQEMKGQIDNQVAALNNARTDAITALETGLKALIDAERAPIVEQLDSARKFYPGVTRGLQRAEADLRILLPEFEAVIRDFKTFKASEATLKTTLTSLSTQASSATVSQLAAIEAQLFAVEREQAARHSQLFARIIDLNARLQAIQVAYSNHLHAGALSAGIAERGLVEADMIGSGARTLGSMLAYGQARDIEMSRAVSALIAGCGQRREALILAQAEEATRTAVANAAHLAESTKFLEEATQRIAILLGTRPKSPTLNLPLYSVQYDDFMSFLQLEPMCQQVSSTNSSWMQTGCNAYAVNFDRARSFLNSLPNSIRLYIAVLRNNGAPETLLTSIQSDLSAGNVRAAASTYDTAVRLVDGS